MRNQESLFYHQMAHLLDAGIALPEAIQSLIPQSPKSLQQKLNLIYQSLKMGDLPLTAFSQSGFGKLELALIEVAEQTGDLSGCFRQLAQHSERMEQLQQKLRAGLSYPIFLLFASPALINLYLLFQSSTSVYLKLLLKNYSCWIAIALGFFFFHRLLRSNYFYNSLLNQIPLLGG
ncbi:MAG: type II secretion system F family protein, partial [Planctomycetota bacterium]